MKKGFKTFVALAALTLLLPGSLAFAKENGSDHRSDRDRTEHRENRDRDHRESREIREDREHRDSDRSTNEQNESVSVDMGETGE